ncbi:MAG: hypothetical protein M1828_002476 [Chrysothrix sp. TS-e1954]|nr:MAG: hypothetical protein M1828_002476 [Chrysothrix sp. TS-e1954]
MSTRMLKAIGTLSDIDKARLICVFYGIESVKPDSRRLAEQTGSASGGAALKMYQTARKKLDDALTKMEEEGSDAIPDGPITPKKKRKAEGEPGATPKSSSKKSKSKSKKWTQGVVEDEGEAALAAAAAAAAAYDDEDDEDIKKEGFE